MKRKMLQKVVALAAVLTMGMSALAGCGQAADGGTAAAETGGGAAATSEESVSQETSSESAAGVEDWESEPIVLTATIVDYSITPYFKEVMDKFTEMHPNVTFNVIDILNSDYIEKVTTMMAGGEDIDLIYSKNNQQYMTLVSNGQIEDLMPYVERDGVDLSIYDGAAEKLTLDGKLYGLPFRNDLWLLYYNKDLFDQAGVDYPTNDMTWEDWAEMCKQMTSGSGADKVYGGYLQNWPASVQNMTISDGKHTTIETDYSFMKDAYEMVVDLQDNGYIMDYSTISTGSLHYTGTFFNQQVATVYQGTWFNTTLLEQEAAGEIPFEWGMVKAPHMSDGQEGDAVGAAFPMCVNSNSAHKEAAWQFVKFLCSEEGAKIVAANGGLPAVRTEEIMELYLSQEGFPEGCESAYEVNQISFEVPVHEKSGVIGTILDEENSLIMTKSLTVEEGLNELTERVNEALNE